MKTKIEILAAPYVRGYAIRSTVLTDENEVVSSSLKKYSFQDTELVLDGEVQTEKVTERHYSTEAEAVDFDTIQKAQNTNV